MRKSLAGRKLAVEPMDSNAPAGYQETKWTGPLLAAWIETKYGIKYQRAQIYNLLRSLGIEFYKKKGLIKI